MEREQIIRMAHTANFEGFGNGDWVCTTEEIVRFAALVAAAERERLKQSIRHSLTIGPKTIQTRVYFGEVEVSMVQMPIEEVVAAEREAAEERVTDLFADMETPYLPDISAAIRARGEKT